MVELSVELAGLSISVRGSPRAATRFVQNLAGESRNNSLDQGSAGEPSGISAAAASFDSALPVAPEPVPASETRVSIQSTFPSLPSYWRIQAETQLTSSRHTPFFRANRAWTAGCWAKAVRQGRVGSPNRPGATESGAWSSQIASQELGASLRLPSSQGQLDAWSRQTPSATHSLRSWKARSTSPQLELISLPWSRRDGDYRKFKFAGGIQSQRSRATCWRMAKSLLQCLWFFEDCQVFCLQFPKASSQTRS